MSPSQDYYREDTFPRGKESFIGSIKCLMKYERNIQREKEKRRNQVAVDRNLINSNRFRKFQPNFPFARTSPYLKRSATEFFFPCMRAIPFPCRLFNSQHEPPGPSGPAILLFFRAESTTFVAISSSTIRAGEGDIPRHPLGAASNFAAGKRTTTTTTSSSSSLSIYPAALANCIVTARLADDDVLNLIVINATRQRVATGQGAPAMTSRGRENNW